MPELDPTARSPGEIDRIVKSAVTPRPIAWVSTRSESGIDNLAPYSSYSYVTSSPAVLLFNASCRDDGRLKDSARNALDTGEFAVNVVTESLARKMDRTSESVSSDVSEFEVADVERADCVRISAPRVADAAMTFECTLYDSKEVYDKTMVLGEVEYVHVAERVLTDGEIDMAKVDTVGRLGGPYYTGAELRDVERDF